MGLAQPPIQSMQANSGDADAADGDAAAADEEKDVGDYVQVDLINQIVLPKPREVCSRSLSCASHAFRPPPLLTPYHTSTTPPPTLIILQAPVLATKGVSIAYLVSMRSKIKDEWTARDVREHLILPEVEQKKTAFIETIQAFQVNIISIFIMSRGWQRG